MQKKTYVMMLMWIVFASFTFAHSDATELCGSDPSVVAFPGTVVNVSCWCTSSTPILLVEDVFRVLNNNDSSLVERNITFMEYKANGVWGYNVSVIATTFSNGTFFSCFPTDCQDNCIKSLDVYIYAAYGPPSPPQAPSLSALNSSMLNISWTSPWSLPVDNYNITMLNSTLSSVQSHWTITQNSLLVTKPHNADCELFEFTVEANTGVGSTGPSQPSTAGFPSSLDDNEPKVCASNTDLMNTIDIYIKVPSICSYETIEYTIIINNTNKSKRFLVSNGKLNQAETWLLVNIEKLDTLPGDILQVILVLFHIDSQPLPVYAYDYLEVSFQAIEITSKIYSAEASFQAMETTGSSPSVTPIIGGKEVEHSLFIVASVSGIVIGAMLCLIISTLLGALVVLIRKSNHKKQRRPSLKTSEEMKVTIPRMCSNPLYDTAPDKIYDEIPSKPATMRSLTLPVLKTNRSGDPQFVYPVTKELQTLQPHGQRSSHIYETTLFPSKHPLCDSVSDKEDYVEMSATGPQESESMQQSSVPTNQPHSASQFSRYSRTNAPPLTATNFLQRSNVGNCNTTIYFRHMEHATNV